MSEVTPHSPGALCVSVCVRLCLIPSPAWQHNPTVLFWSRIGQQPYLQRHRPSGSPSTQHGQQSRMCVREGERLLVCAEQAH